MLSAEPPYTPYDLHFRVAGFNVRVHPFFWLMAVLLNSSGFDPIALFLWLVAVFVSILVHEMGHALAFRHYGIQSHIVLYAFGGLAVPDSQYNYFGRSSRTASHKSQIIIALAGPMAGFILAGLIIGVIYAAGEAIAVSGWFIMPTGIIGTMNVTLLIMDLLVCNIVWGLFNLLPIFPLDGGQVSMQLFDRHDSYRGQRRALVLSCYTAGILAAGSLGLFLRSHDPRDLWMPLMLGSLAFASYQMLQQSSGGGYGGSEW